MPSDPLGTLRDLIQSAAERAAEKVLSGQSIAPRVAQMATDAQPSIQMAQFATGYDGTNTLVPFMLDYSLLDGDDLLAG